MGKKLRFRRFRRRKGSIDSDKLSVQTLPAIIEHEETGAGGLDTASVSSPRAVSVLCLMRDGSIHSVKQLVKVFEMKMMSEGRKTQVILLDDRRLDLLVQPKLYSTELLDIVASHFNLKEKEYFGLSFKDETGHHHWLHLDRKVLEHDFPKKPGPMVLYFGVRFFIESIGYLRDNATIELFFLQAKQAVFKAQIEVDSETAFELAAHVLQASFGDFTDDVSAKKQLKKLPVLPTSVLREHPNLDFCEEQVLAHYRKLEGHTRGSAIVNYMTVIESLPTYGIHYYEVKDKSGIPWWLGLSYKGISLYDYADKRVPRRVFAWKQLENLYFRDKKFSIEVHDPKRIVHTLSSFNLYEDAIQEPLEEFDELSDAISDPTTQVSVSRRTFGPGNVNVHAWLASTPQLTKCIWSMAVSQHQFYLDRKQSKSQLPQVRSMSEIATDLCHSSSSLQSSAANSADGISRSNSAHSLTLSTYNSRTELTAEDIESSRAAHKEMFVALKARKDALEEALRKKTEELKAICLKEAEITGTLPVETPLAPGEPLPQIRRRVGTAFTLSPKNINRDQATEVEETLAQLELELELQDNLTKARYRLTQDKAVAKSVRKQRKQQYQKSYQKLKDIEKKLNEYREHSGKIPVKIQTSLEESEFISPVASPSVHRHDYREVGKGRHSNSHRSSTTNPSSQQQHMKIITSPKAPFQHHHHHHHQQQHHTHHQPRSSRQHSSSSSSSAVSQQSVPHPQHKSAPASPVRQPHGAPRVSTPSPNPGRHYSSGGGGGYIPNAVYSTRNTYRNQMYPTYSTKEASGGGHMSGSHSDYENSSRSSTSSITQQSNSSNRHTSHADKERNQRNDNIAVNNLYNVHSNKMSSYNSADELKSPASEDYDSCASDQEHGGVMVVGGRWQGPYQGQGDHHPMEAHGAPRGYGSLDRNKGRQNIMLAELSPSKFGSKRESHSDYRDSPYQPLEMPPLPRNLSDVHEVVAPSGYRATGQFGSGHPGPDDPSAQDDTSSHNTSIPFIDSSQSSISVPGNGAVSAPQWYDPKGGQPYPQYDNSGQTPYGRADDQTVPYSYDQGAHPDRTPQGHVDHHQHQRGSPQYQGPPPPAGPQTVTKYQSYVEVSKPFEMSDFYKYSERLRRQRVQDSPPGHGSAQPSYSPSPSAPRTPHNAQAGSVRAQSQPVGTHSGVTSGYSSSSSSSRSRPSSPFSQPQQQQPPQDTTYTVKYPSSPYTDSPGADSSPGGQTPYNHHHHPQAYISHTPQPGLAYQTSHNHHQPSPKHMAYQPPKPLNCQPLPRGDSPSYTSTPSSAGAAHRTPKSDSKNNSFGSFNMSSGVAKAFSEEMLAWYDDNDATPTSRTPGPKKRSYPRQRTKFI